MMNTLILVGRIVDLTEDKFTLAIARSFKNPDGIYETDFIDIKVFNPLAINTIEYCHKGDIVSVRGRLQTSNYENEQGEKCKKIEVIAEKITYLTNKYDE